MRFVPEGEPLPQPPVGEHAPTPGQCRHPGFLDGVERFLPVS